MRPFVVGQVVPSSKGLATVGVVGANKLLRSLFRVSRHRDRGVLLQEAITLPQLIGAGYS